MRKTLAVASAAVLSLGVAAGCADDDTDSPGDPGIDDPIDDGGLDDGGDDLGG